MAEPTRLELADKLKRIAESLGHDSRYYDIMDGAAALRSAQEEIASLTKELDAIAAVLDVSRTSSRPLVCFVDDEVKANERAEEEIGRLNQYISQLEYSAASHQLLAEQAEAALAEMRRMLDTAVKARDDLELILAGDSPDDLGWISKLCGEIDVLARHATEGK